jgi:hypothetical protein
MPPASKRKRRSSNPRIKSGGSSVTPQVTTTLLTVSIAAGQSVSAAGDCRTATPVRLRMPATWNADYKAEVVTFLGSTDNIKFWNLHRTDGSEISVVVLPGDNSVILPTDLGLKGGQWIKIRAGTRDNPVTQEAQRDFVFVLEA